MPYSRGESVICVSSNSKWWFKWKRHNLCFNTPVNQGSYCKGQISFVIIELLFGEGSLERENK